MVRNLLFVMKTPSRFAALIAALAIVFPGATALAEDEKIAQIKKLLEELRELKTTATENKEQRNVDIIETLLQASSSERNATNFYLKCVKTVNFERAERRSSEFRDWEDRRNIERDLKADEHAVALQLQLRWLAISLRAATENDIQKLTDPIYEFMGDYFKVEKDLGGYRRMLLQPVSQTVFAQAYRLEDTLKLNDKNWELAPGRIDSIFDKTIMPFYRAMDDVEKLEEAWAMRLGAVKKRAESLETAEAKKQYVEVEYPRLQWKRDLDIYKVARTDARLMGLVKHIKDHIHHAESGTWIDDVMGLLEGMTGEEEPEEDS